MLLLLSAIGLLFAPIPPVHSIGIATFTTVDARHADTIRATVFYPSTSASRDTTLGLLPARVAVHGTLTKSSGRYPVVVISHGTGGNEFGHLDTIESLVSAGYVVVALRHAGDNYRDESALGTDRYLYGRSTQVTAVLDDILKAPEWSGVLDRARIGVVGYSVGGMTALELVGGRPDPARIDGYCRIRQRDSLMCVSGAGRRFAITGRYPAPSFDRRIRSAVLLAPAWSFLFDRRGVAYVNVPLLIERAERDSTVVEPENVQHLVSVLPHLPQLGVMRGAAHETFLAPCSAALAREVPDICIDPPGVSREALHTELNARIVRFFNSTLRAGTG